MNEPTKKTEPTEQEAKTTELSEKDLEQAAGGAAAAPTTSQQQAAHAHKGAQSMIKFAGS